MKQKTWLITGSGNGLGRNIAEAALKAGDNVVAIRVKVDVPHTNVSARSGFR